MEHASYTATPLGLIKEARATLYLAIPLIIGQLSQMLMGIVDTLMIGRIGVTELAAASLAINVLHIPMMFGIGMAIAVSIRVSQARGAQTPTVGSEALRHGVWIAFAIGTIAFIAALLTLPLLARFRQDPDVVRVVPGYYRLLALSLIPGSIAMALKHFADAMNRPWPAFWIMLGSVFANVVFNWVMIYGNAGFPALGLTGAGLATFLARLASMLGLFIWLGRSKDFLAWFPGRWCRALNLNALRHLIKVGLPSSFQLLAEVGVFVAASLIIGAIGKESLASHQVAITCAATVFMIPLGISMALTVRVGEAWGAQQHERLRQIALGGWGLALLVTCASALTVFLAKEPIAQSFLSEPKALAITLSLLMISVAFQFSDAMQVVSAGILRGLDDVKTPAWLAFATYWGLALPVGYFLAIPQKWGASGMWWGITLGLTTTAVLLGTRVWLKTSFTLPKPVQ